MYCAQVSVLNHSKGLAEHTPACSWILVCLLSYSYNNPTSLFRHPELRVLPGSPEADDGAGDPGPLLREHQLRLHDGPVPPRGQRDPRHRGLRALGASSATREDEFSTTATKTLSEGSATSTAARSTQQLHSGGFTTATTTSTRTSTTTEILSTPQSGTETETRKGESRSIHGNLKMIITFKLS